MPVMLSPTRIGGLAMLLWYFIALTGAVDWQSLHCPQTPEITLPTPSYGLSGSVFTVCSELNIHAGIADVYKAIIDYQRYPEWNSFVFSVDLPANVSKTPDQVSLGLRMNFHTAGLVPSTNTTSEEIVTVLDDSGSNGYFMVAWKYDDTIGGAGSRAEHPNILVDQGNNVTRYLSFETYYLGLTTPILVLLRQNLQKQFEQQGLDLKAYVEK